MHAFDDVLHLCGAALRVGAEIGIGEHGHDRRAVEEAHRRGGEAGYVFKSLLVGVAVDERVGDEVDAFLGIYEVHRGEVVIALANSDYFIGHLNRIGIFRVKTGDESVCFARFHHHHAEIVSLVHLVDSLLKRVALSLHLIRQNFGVAAASVGLVVISEVEDFDVADLEVHLLCHAAYLVFIAEEHGVADAFGLGFHGCFEHRGVGALSKYHALGVHACRVVEVLGELGFLPH